MGSSGLCERAVRCGCLSKEDEKACGDGLVEGDVVLELDAEGDGDGRSLRATEIVFTVTRPGIDLGVAGRMV